MALAGGGAGSPEEARYAPPRQSARLGQGCSAQSCWVEIAPWRDELPPITAFDPPRFIEV
ncbi:hypothetical protein A7K92_27545 [Klebsiella pneumoniae]|nr:hypothetical protein A7K92_27545 [Klebsiella pneumoniae]